MKNNMQYNFEILKERVRDALDKTDLEYIKNELSKLNKPTIFSGVGGSSVVSELGSKIISEKNNIISINSEPRDFIYRNNQFNNIISCSYSGNNYGVELSFIKDKKKYLLSNNSYDEEDITYLKYQTLIEKEKSFISLAATVIPASILLNYYINDNNTILELINEEKFDFEIENDIYEIFSGYDTSTSAKYLESTMIESGIGIPIIHDKYSYCHGRSTFGINFTGNVIYFNKNTEFDQLLLKELPKYYKNIIIIDSEYNDDILVDYQLLIKSMYLTKYIAEKKNKDLSKVNYSPIVKKLYKYNGKI